MDRWKREQKEGRYLLRAEECVDIDGWIRRYDDQTGRIAHGGR